MDVHESLLEIICVFDTLCRQHNIQYSLHGGTLLGAIREHGFIPWDDDMDVAMTRENFIKLTEVLNQAEIDYCIKGRIKKQFYKINEDKAWVDIFICDYISEKRWHQKVKQLLLTLLDVMNRNQKSRHLSNLGKYSKKKQLAFQIVFILGQIIPKSWTAKLYDWISEKFFLGRRKMMFRSNDQYCARKLIFPSEWMEKYERKFFEGKQLPVSSFHRQLLIQSYGESYMIPVQENRNTRVHDLVRSGIEL